MGLDGHCGLKGLDIIHTVVSMISETKASLHVVMLHVQEENYAESAKKSETKYGRISTTGIMG